MELSFFISTVHLFKSVSSVWGISRVLTCALQGSLSSDWLLSLSGLTKRHLFVEVEKAPVYLQKQGLEAVILQQAAKTSEGDICVDTAKCCSRDTQTNQSKKPPEVSVNIVHFSGFKSLYYSGQRESRVHGSCDVNREEVNRNPISSPSPLLICMQT